MKLFYIRNHFFVLCCTDIVAMSRREEKINSITWYIGASKLTDAVETAGQGDRGREVEEERDRGRGRWGRRDGEREIQNIQNMHC